MHDRSTKEYEEKYTDAQKAYYKGNYQEAATIIDRMAEDFPDEPTILLLRGHIYYRLQQYEFAQKQYESVLRLTQDIEYINYANKGLELARQLQNQKAKTEHECETEANYDYSQLHQTEAWTDEEDYYDPLDDSATAAVKTDISDSIKVMNDSGFHEGLEENSDSEETHVEPLLSGYDNNSNAGNLFPDSNDYVNSFEGEPDETSMDWEHFREESETNFGSLEPGDYSDKLKQEPQQYDGYDRNTGANEVILTDNKFNQSDDQVRKSTGLDSELIDSELDTFIDSKSSSDTFLDDSQQDTVPTSYPPNKSQPGSDEEKLTFCDEMSGNTNVQIADNFSSDDIDISTTSLRAHGSEPMAQSKFNIASEEISARQTEVGFSEEFDVLNDEELDLILNFDHEDVDPYLADSGLFNPNPEDLNPDQSRSSSSAKTGGRTSPFSSSDYSTSTRSNLTSFTQGTVAPAGESVEFGLLSWFKNAPFSKKQWLTAAIAGTISLIAAGGVSYISSTWRSERNTLHSSILTAGTAGLASFGTTLFLGKITREQINRSTRDLQDKFEAVSQGNLDVLATVYTSDEFGQLAVGFNQMAQTLLSTTRSAQEGAKATEQAREDLQRQVICLLDDVEGAARGDLTVQAEVTADVLGAVADAFNNTIQNLRSIVQQVKQAARQVNQNATDSEAFARNLSGDAWRQAEELAVTLNSVQMMTESIQRVAENAADAEEVARSASTTALRGGEAVEHTVAGILKIRDTVAQTNRKVKRLAESAQEISKIVAVISTIASRTNLLALNASIEAARAGEAGRGFAVVADEVRQLADRSAKALKEIEQIVSQIQSETSKVQTAMEESQQQVIDGTKRAEQAKRSLEDIIQVSNRIDALVRSITADTVEQRENSRTVAQVTQSVELAAQETSQESQRVAGSLQNLVGIARNLLSSVERFRVEASEE